VNLAIRLATAAALLAAAAATPAAASDITVTVTDAAGKPVPNAVVTIDAPGRRPPPRSFTISQREMRFVPEVLVIPLGSTVTFGNLDPFRHHVYSFSEPKKFEIKLFGQGETRPVVFSQAGLVSIGCNIHDAMEAFVHVVDTPFAERTDARGRVTLHDVPGGRHAVKVWHSRLRAPGHQMTLQADTDADRTIPVQVRLRAPAPQMNHY
jgi:plastocyanin